MAEKITGILRAIEIMGTQEKLAAALTKRLRMTKPLRQSRISVWVKIGYVPKARARAVAKLTGVPLPDLLRQPKPKDRNAKGSN